MKNNKRERPAKAAKNTERINTERINSKTEQRRSYEQGVKPAGKIIGAVYELVSVFISAVFIILILFTFVCRFVGVIGDSMIPTLHNGDWLVISQYTPKVTNGDIVIVTQPNQFDENIVKRVIATGGQTIDIDFSSGAVFVDGLIIEEPYINNDTTDKFDVEFPLNIPNGYVFVMGDNRQHSVDSRSTMIGLIREEYILGKAVYNISASNGFVEIK